MIEQEHIQMIQTKYLKKKQNKDQVGLMVEKKFWSRSQWSCFASVKHQTSAMQNKRLMVCFNFFYIYNANARVSKLNVNTDRVKNVFWEKPLIRILLNVILFVACNNSGISLINFLFDDNQILLKTKKKDHTWETH